MSESKSELDGLVRWVMETFSNNEIVREEVNLELLRYADRCGLTDEETRQFVETAYSSAGKVLPMIMGQAAIEALAVAIADATAKLKGYKLSRKELRQIKKDASDSLATFISVDARDGRKPTHAINSKDLRRHYKSIYPLWQKAKRSAKIRAKLPPLLVAHLLHTDPPTNTSPRDWDKLVGEPAQPKPCALLHAAILSGEPPLTLSSKQLSRILHTEKTRH